MFWSAWSLVPLLLARSVLSISIPSLQLNGEPLSKRALTITDPLLHNLTYYAQHSAAAYCNSAAAPSSLISCAHSGCPDVAAHNTTVVTSFSGPATGIGGFVAVDPVREEIVVAFRGSSNLRNWLANILFGFSPCADLGKDCQVHTGFQSAYDEISTPARAGLDAARALHPTYAVITTGHSLGGAVANLFAAHTRASSSSSSSFPITLYTYGSPRVGNGAYATLVNAQTAGAEFRVTHGADPVPRMPPLLFGYRHTGPELWLSTGSATTVKYAIGDVKVCEGPANINCNAGSLDFDVDAHDYYLVDMGACNDALWRRRDDEEEEGVGL